MPRRRSRGAARGPIHDGGAAGRQSPAQLRACDTGAWVASGDRAGQAARCRRVMEPCCGQLLPARIARTIRALLFGVACPSRAPSWTRRKPQANLLASDIASRLTQPVCRRSGGDGLVRCSYARLPAPSPCRAAGRPFILSTPFSSGSRNWTSRPSSATGARLGAAFSPVQRRVLAASSSLERMCAASQASLAMASAHRAAGELFLATSPVPSPVLGGRPPLALVERQLFSRSCGGRARARKPVARHRASPSFTSHRRAMLVARIATRGGERIGHAAATR